MTPTAYQTEESRLRYRGSALGQTLWVCVLLGTIVSALLAAGQTTSARRLQVERDAISALENASPWSGPSSEVFDKLSSLGDPTPFEHTWVLAYVAEWERAVSLGNYPKLLDDAVRRSLRRFPQESRLRLARLTARPEALAISNRPSVPVDRLARFGAWGAIRLPPGRTPNPPFVPNPKTIPLTREELRDLAHDAGVGDEARARLAMLEFLLGDVDASVKDIAGAITSSDPYVRNLAGLVEGLSWEAKAQPDRALAAYRAAVEAMPQSEAAVVFATHAFLAGQRAAADRALAEALAPRPFVIDPWDGLGADDRFLPRYLADLRTMAGLPARANDPISLPDTPSPFWVGPGRFATVVQPLMRIMVPAISSEVSVATSPPAPVTPPVLAARIDSQTYRATTTSVLLDASVRLNNRPVVGLSPADFNVLDNGVSQTVEAVSVEPIPLDVSIVIDTANGKVWAAGGLVHDPWADAVPRFADVLAALHPDDRVRIIEANLHAVELLPWTSMRDLAGRPWALKSVPPSHGGVTAAIFDAMAAALMQPAPVNRRNLVLVLTDGIDGVSVTKTAELERVAKQSDGIVLLLRHETDHERQVGRWMERHTPGAPFPMDHENEQLLWPKDIVGLERAVRESRGYVFNVRDGSTSADRVREVLADFAKRYLLRYTAHGVALDGWHTLTVRVNRPGKYTIDARRGYFGG